MATRLAENGTYTVAVVEAGGFYELENGNLTIVPGYYSQNLGHASVDWNFKTTPQASLENQTFDYARGKTLGGRYVKEVFSLSELEAYMCTTVPLSTSWPIIEERDNHMPHGQMQWMINPTLSTLSFLFSKRASTTHHRTTNISVQQTLPFLRQMLPLSRVLMVPSTFLTLTGLHRSLLGANLL